MTAEKTPKNPLTLVLALSAVFFIIFLIFSGVLFLSKGPRSTEGKLSSSSFFSTGRGTVGIVEMNGVILDSKKTLAKLEKLEDSDQVKAVVLRLNSPGGAVAPSQEIYEYVKAYKKPLVVSMGSVAASGAYYIACGAKKVFANPGTMTGSIGVIMEFANLAKLYDWAKVQRYSIKTGEFKDVGAEYRQMTPKERALLQTMVNNILDQFKSAVAKGRNLSLKQVTEIADGRIFTGSQAKALHLVDELGTIRDAIKEAAKEGGIQGKPHIHYMEKKKNGLMDLLLNDDSFNDSSDSQSSVAFSLLYRLFSLVKGGDLSGISSYSGWTDDRSSQSLRQRVPGVYWLWNGSGVF